MLRLASILFCSLALSAPALAQSCDEDSIESIRDEGKIIVMSSGAVFRVSPDDRADVAGWLAGDDVLICNDHGAVINKDEDGARVAVRRVHRK